MDNEAIGRFLWALRREKGWKQQEAAARLGVTDKTVSKWETGRGLPDISALPEVAALYGVTVDELLAGARHKAENEKSAGSAENMESMESAAPGTQQEAAPERPAKVRPKETPAVKWAFRLYCAACILEGAAVIANGINAVLLCSYFFFFDLNANGLQDLGDATLADRADAWLQQVLIPWQHTSQSLTLSLLPLASAVLLLWALGRRLPCKTVLRRALIPAVLAFGLSALVLLPIWETPHLFLDWVTLYLCWLIALVHTATLFSLYLALQVVLCAVRWLKKSRGGKTKTE